MKLIPHPHAMTASFMLGKALLALFPKAQLGTSQVWGPYFIYRFTLDHALQKEQLMPLQEALYREAESQKKIESIEMMASNARELFKHQKQYGLQKRLPQHPSEIISLLRHGDHYDFFEAPYSPLFEGKVSLVHVVSRHAGDKEKKHYQVEVWGVWGADTREIKTQKKALNEQMNHQSLDKGRQFDFLFKDKEHAVLLTKGAEFIQALKNKFETEARLMNLNSLVFYPSFGKTSESFLTSQITPQKSFYLFQTWSEAKSKENYFFNNVLFTAPNKKFTLGGAATQRSLKETCNYCLKFLLKIFKILGFSYKVVFCTYPEALCLKQVLIENAIEFQEGPLEKGSCLQIELIDQWGRSALACNLKLSKIKETFLLKVEGLVTLEDLFFWMLQAHDEEELKKWIA